MKPNEISTDTAPDQAIKFQFPPLLDEDQVQLDSLDIFTPNLDEEMERNKIGKSRNNAHKMTMLSSDINMSMPTNPIQKS